MSKYAVVKIGASQEKVSIGDELVVSSSFSETTLIPILVSPKKGELVSDNKELKKLIFSNIKTKLAIEEEWVIGKITKLLK